MRDHSKNIGKKVYFRTYYGAINNGIIVEIVKNIVRIFSYTTNKIEDLYPRDFRNINSRNCWAYEEKNVVYKPKESKKTYQIKVYDFYNTRIKEFKTIEEFYKFLNLEENHNYDRRIKRIYNFFKKDKEFKGFLVKDNHVSQDDFFDLKHIHFYIKKEYIEDENKPRKIIIKFVYAPPYQESQWISINKFDKFIFSYELIKGEKYFESNNNKQ